VLTLAPYLALLADERKRTLKPEANASRRKWLFR
jgi:hypothetical protein